MDPQLGALICSFKATTGSRLDVAEHLGDEFDQWLQETLNEAKAIFRKPKEDTIEEELQNGDDSRDATPVLLPQTPRVKKARNKARKQSICPPEVETGGGTGRPLRAASRAAKNVITMTVNEKLNSKKRRPSNESSSGDGSSSKTSSVTSLVQGSSSTSSLTKKLSDVQIDSETIVHFEAETSKGEPNEKKPRLKPTSSIDEPAPATSEAMEADDEQGEGIPKSDEMEVCGEERPATRNYDLMEQPGDEEHGKAVEEPKKPRSVTRSVSQQKSNTAPMDVDAPVGEQPAGSDDVQGTVRVEPPPGGRRMTRSVSRHKLRKVAAEEEERGAAGEVAADRHRKLLRSLSQPDLHRDDKMGEAEPVQETKESKRMTRSISQQKLQDASRPVYNMAENGIRRTTRSVSHSRHVEASKGEAGQRRAHQQSSGSEASTASDKENPEPRRSERKKAVDVPVVRVTAPSVSDLEPAVGVKYKTLPRTNRDTQKDVSSANIRLKSPTPLKGNKAPSTSSLNTATKLSSNKAANTRKVRPHSPAAKMQGVETISTGSSLTSKFKSRIGGLANLASPLVAVCSSSKAPANVSTAAASFLPARPQRAVKPTEKELRVQKEEELKKKKEKEEEVLRRKEERERQQRESKRKENEARQRKVLQSRQALEQSRQQTRLQHEKEAKEKLEAIKLANQMAAERRRKEEEERRKREEEEKQRKKEEERLKELERERQRKQEEEEAKQLKLRQAAEMAAASKEKEMNCTFTKPADLNSTYSKTKKEDVQSYEITPARHELPQEALANPNNYDIADLRSDEDTDEEDNPRKKPAAWSLGRVFKLALMQQAYSPPDLDQIFFIQDASPRLEEIFDKRKRRFYTRTSSAVWDSPPMSHGYK